jgi:hypothetical protein
MAQTSKRPGRERSTEARQQQNTNSDPEFRGFSNAGKVLLKAALKTAQELGPVFPCNPENKRPFTKHGFKDATRDPAKIERWWRRWPNALIGVPTGSMSGMFAVDLDRKKPKPGEEFHDGVAAWAEWTAQEGAVETRVSETPSGGQHLLFRAQDGIRNIPLHRLGPGIEIKGEGGYIIVPPSRHKDGAYRWINNAPITPAPQWLIEKILALRAPRQDHLTNGLSPEHLERVERDAGRGQSQHPEDLLYPPPTRSLVKAALDQIDPDINRVDWIAIGCGLCNQFGDEGYELWNDWSAKGKKYNAREMDGQWRSISNHNGYNYTIATVFHFANEANPNWRRDYEANQEETEAKAEPETESEPEYPKAEPEPKPKPNPATGVIMVRVADVESKKIDWLWPARIPRGKLTIIAGMPDVNKSTFSLDLAARVTREAELPCGEGRAPLGSVIILSAEDDIADTIRPRLEVMGADLMRVHIITAVKPYRREGERGFDLSQDIDHLEEAVEKLRDVALIVIDPITAYMGKPGKFDSYRSTDVRAILAPLQMMAAKCGAAVVCIDHLNKNVSQAQAMLRILNSISFVAAARAIFIIARDPEDDERRLLLPVKTSVSKIRTGLAFRIIERLTPEPLFDAQPAIKWEDGATITMTADEVLAFKPDGRRSEGTEAAKGLILQMLNGKAARATEIEARATELKITRQSLKTAKKAIGVNTTRIDNAWWWSLPGQEKPL